MTKQPFLKARIVAVLLTAGLLAAVPGSAETADIAANLYTHASENGEAYFAVGLRANPAESRSRAPGNHVVLFDTSASQVGEHREYGLDVLKSFLGALNDDDRVCLVAVDVKANRLHEEFAPPESQAVGQALDALRNRFPAGATDLPQAVRSALEMIPEEQRPASITYIGDGMSMANLARTDQLQTLLNELRGRRVPVHSCAVGPKTDLPLLGLFAQYTGGVVLRDDGDEQDAGQTGTELASAAAVPAVYPAEMTFEPELTSLAPDEVLPLRPDRETIYLGRGEVPQTVTMTATVKAGQQDKQETWRGRMRSEDASPGHSVLGALWRRAEQREAPFAGGDVAGRALLFAAQEEFDTRVEQMVQAGEQAAAAGQLDNAEQIALNVRNFAPHSTQGRALLTKVTRGQTDAQASSGGPRKAGGGRLAQLELPADGNAQ